MFKKEMRVLGVDDGPFGKFGRGNVFVVGAVFRGGSWLDGVLTTKAAIDGNNSTSRLVSMINSCRYRPQLQCIMLDGISLGGFNVVDIEELRRKTGIPVIVVIRKFPDIERIKGVLKKIGKEKKIALLEKAGEIQKVNDIHVQLCGLGIDEAREILRITCTRSNIPEPLRIAHIIASGVVLGESRGRA